MPVSIEFLRGVLGVLSLFFAWQAGRVLAAVRKGEVRQSRLVGWMVRALVCAVGVIFPQRSIDRVVLTVWALAVLAFLAGVRLAARQKKEEDLTRTIFPDES
jgi:hypothetical protein